jgi:DNA-binding transcriptional MerR regulator
MCVENHDHERDDYEILTSQEVADLLRIAVNTLYWWQHRGFGPPSFKAGKQRLYKRQDVLNWIDQQFT